MLNLDFKWTVRLDMGPFMGDESDRLVWHLLSPAVSIEDAIAETWKAYPNATDVTAFPKWFV